MIKKDKKAILFLNMGAPRNLDEVGLFLKNMFNDKNIITVKNNLLRKYIAHSIIKSRINDAKESYKEVGGISPLVKYTKNFIENVKKEFPSYYVVSIMRYTPPFALDELLYLKAKKVENLIVIPLYPHYSTTTVKSSLEDLQEALNRAKYRPNLKIWTRFYKDINYNQAIIKNIEKSLKNRDSNEYNLIFSAHSLPVSIIENGDTYQDEIIENVSILKDMLRKQNMNFYDIHLAYQSKVGPTKWLEPTLESVLSKLKNKKVLIYPISFVLDNSETVVELDIEYRKIANKLKYEDYIVSKTLNNSKTFIKTIKNLVNQPI